MDKRAEAFAHYNDAAVLQMLVEVLPEMAEKVAAPLASIDKLTVISTDGAAALPKQVSENLMQTLQLVKDTTGYDLTSIIDRFASGARGRPDGREGRGRAASPAPTLPKGGRGQASERKSFSSLAASMALFSGSTRQARSPVEIVRKAARSTAFPTAASCVTMSSHSRPDSIIAMMPPSWPWARLSRLTTVSMSAGGRCMRISIRESVHPRYPGPYRLPAKGHPQAPR